MLLAVKDEWLSIRAILRVRSASPWPEEGDRNGPQNRADFHTQSKKEVPFRVFSSRAKMRAKFDRFS